MADSPRQNQKQNKSKYPTFAEVYPKGDAFPGTKKVPIEQIVDSGREVLIKEYQRRPSKFEDSREMAILHCYSKAVNEQPPHDFSVATGSVTIISQLEATKSRLPYRARFVKVKNYFSLA